METGGLGGLALHSNSVTYYLCHLELVNPFLSLFLTCETGLSQATLAGPWEDEMIYTFRFMVHEQLSAATPVFHSSVPPPHLAILGI